MLAFAAVHPSAVNRELCQTDIVFDSCLKRKDDIPPSPSEPLLSEADYDDSKTPILPSKLAVSGFLA